MPGAGCPGAGCRVPACRVHGCSGLPSDLALMAEISVQVCLPSWPSRPKSACKFAFRPGPHGRNQRASLPSDLDLRAEISVQVCLPTLATIGELAPPVAHTLRDPCATANFDNLAPKLARNLRTPCADDPFVVTRAIHSSANCKYLADSRMHGATGLACTRGAQHASIEAPRTVSERRGSPNAFEPYHPVRKKLPAPAPRISMLLCHNDVDMVIRCFGQR